MEGFKKQNKFGGPINTGNQENANMQKQGFSPLGMDSLSVADLNREIEPISKTKYNDSILSDAFIQENKSFLNAGKELIGEAHEKEFILDSERVNKIMDQDDYSIRFTEHRSEMIADAIEKNKAPQRIMAGEVLSGFNKKVIKKGKFDANSIASGKQFFKWVSKWAGMSDEPTDTEKSFYENLGPDYVLNFLKVDDMNFKDFIKKKYDYDGRSVGDNSSSDVYGAYIAMILRRQNHSITLVSPTFDGQKASVEIKSLDVVFNEKSRDVRSKNIISQVRNQQYKDVCAHNFKKEAIKEAAKAMRKSSGAESLPSNDLHALRDEVTKAGKGTHKNYDDFVNAFDEVLLNLDIYSLDPDQTMDQENIASLFLNIQAAIAKADSYLKGKKMNLPRHFAVQNVRDALKEHLEFYSPIVRDKRFWNSKAKVPVKDFVNLQKTAEDMSYEGLKFKDKVSKEEFKQNGGVTKHKYVTITEADRLIKESGGMVCAIKVPGKPLLREIRPSFVKETTINGQKIPVCKTFQYIFKSIGMLMTDQDGNVKTEEDKYKDIVIEDRLDKLLGLCYQTDRNRGAKQFETLDNIIKPKVVEIITDSYRKSGKKINTQKIADEAEEVINNYKTLMKVMENPLNHSTDISLLKFKILSRYIKEFNPEEFANTKEGQELLKSGDITLADIEDAFKDFHEEFIDAQEDIKSLRNLDMSTDEVPTFNSCIPNASLFRNINTDFQKKEFVPLGYRYKAQAKHDIGEFIDFMAENVENYILMDDSSEEEARSVRAEVAELKEKYAKKGTMSEEEFKKFFPMITFSTLSGKFAKYQGHQSAVLGIVDNKYLVAESTATEPDQLINSPLTMKAHVGQYQATEKELKNAHNNNFAELNAESFQKYHDHDDYYGYVASKKRCIKTKIATYIKHKAEHEASKKSEYE